MGILRQEEIGRCEFIDVLEEAVVVKRPVAVTLNSGETFIDTVKDVVTFDGRDWVDFVEHDRLPVSDIRGMTRAEPTRH